MNIALVNSGSAPCEHCGAREPIVLGGFGTPIAADITAELERQLGEREAALEAIAAEQQARIVRAGREAIVSMEQLLKQEVQATRLRMERAHAEYEAAVEDAVTVRAKWYRPLKRRWERRLASEVEAAVDALKDQTRRA